MRTVITGSGSFIPESIKCNRDFEGQVFHDETGKPVERNQKDTIQRFQEITGIRERRYAGVSFTAADMAALAAAEAIKCAGVDMETLDHIIVAHNFGNSPAGELHAGMVPSVASLTKHLLGISNPACVAYDILFGCPGWLQGLIQADAFIRSGMARKCLVIGTEILSRNSDPYDRDSMIYSDGAGAVVAELYPGSDGNKGIIGTASLSYTKDEVHYINMGKSYCPDNTTGAAYLKMQGRKVYEFALKYVPQAIKACIDSCGVPISDIKKIFIHQANEKMDEAIVERLYKLYGIHSVPERVMPMNIRYLGNSSVATIPTLFDMVVKGELEGHALHKDDTIIFASVGAGMNINAACYRL